jgi:hypothetical protein
MKTFILSDTNDEKTLREMKESFIEYYLDSEGEEEEGEDNDTNDDDHEDTEEIRGEESERTDSEPVSRRKRRISDQQRQQQRHHHQHQVNEHKEFLIHGQTPVVDPLVDRLLLSFHSTKSSPYGFFCLLSPSKKTDYGDESTRSKIQKG